MERLELQENTNFAEIEKVIHNAKISVVQSSKPIPDKLWQYIGQHLIPKRPDIEIRIYGHYSSTCDLSCLTHIRDVEKLAVDSLMEAQSVDYLGKCQNLKSLSVGIFSLQSFDFLGDLPSSLNTLLLGSTKSKKPSLDKIRRLENLTTLYIEGQSKGIENIGNLSKLEKLVLRSVSPKDIRFIRHLKKLWSLDIKLGGMHDLSDIEALDNIKYLELWQIRGLSDISVISSLVGLQYLFLQSLPNIESFPDLSRLDHLRRVYLENMKGLKRIDGLLKASSLEEYIHVSAQNMSPGQYEPLLKLDTLRRILVGFGSDKKNDLMVTMMADAGIDKYTHTPFDFNFT